MKPIIDILNKFGIPQKGIYQYGSHIAKLAPILKKPSADKKLILVTAISPTPAGEGKTTVSIGLNDAINSLKHKSIVALREPSMGPVFGVKGGANGGGKAQIIPKDDIDLHFTGDFHAITAANNLIAACIDNHIYWGNELQIDLTKIVWRRVMDVNDRAVREIEVTINAKKNLKYKTGFDITAASELMAIFCLSNSVDEMKERINNIIVAFNNGGEPIYVKDFNIINAIMKILQMAIYPNCVQSLEGNLAFVHGGPFANIAHGCNSVFATKTAMNLAEYTVTEAGFGSDLGAEKFLDIVCDNANIKPNAVVLVASIRSLKMHGGADAKNLTSEDLISLRNGFENLQQHIKNIQAFGLPVIVALNQFTSDTNSEIKEVGKFLDGQNIPYSFTTLFAKGSKGAQELAKKVIQLSSTQSKIKPAYSRDDTLKTKIENIVKRCYGAQGIILSDEANRKLSQWQNTKAYVCVAKTPLTFSDDPKQIMIKEPFSIHINDLLIANGANFIIAMAGDIFRMPGLPKEPAACKM